MIFKGMSFLYNLKSICMKGDMPVIGLEKGRESKNTYDVLKRKKIRYV